MVIGMSFYSDDGLVVADGRERPHRYRRLSGRTS